MQLESLWKQVEPVSRAIPSRLRNTVFLRTFGFLKVPMLFYASPTVLELNDEQCKIQIKLNRKTKNHFNSMYFGALAVGADCAGGLMAMHFIHAAGVPVSVIFKDFRAEFLKRAEGDVHFLCPDGRQVKELVEKTITTGERQSGPVEVVATVPSQFGDEPVAKFILTLSLKKKAGS